MTQNVHCTLSIFGLVNSTIFSAVRLYLETDLNALCSDPGGSGNFTADVADVPDGKIPDALKTWLIGAKVNFHWEWDGCYDFSEGALMYDAVRGVLHEADMTCGEICILASKLNDEDAINAAAEAYAFRQQTAFMQCVTFDSHAAKNSALAGLEDLWKLYGKDTKNG